MAQKGPGQLARGRYRAVAVASGAAMGGADAAEAPLDVFELAQQALASARKGREIVETAIPVFVAGRTHEQPFADDACHVQIHLQLLPAGGL